MFKSLFSLFGQVMRIFSSVEDTVATSKNDLDKGLIEETPQKRGSLILDDETSTTDPLHLEVDEVNVLSGDWGESVPQRASALFPQTLPKLAPKPIAVDESNQFDVQEVNDRSTPSPEQLFEEATADLTPKEPPQKPDRPLPKSVLPETLPVVPPAPSSKHYSAHVQVGRLVKQDPEPPDVPKLTRPPEIIHSGKKGRRRLIQSLNDKQSGHRAENHHYARNASNQHNLPSLPRGVNIPQDSDVSYHDIEGERGASSRAQYGQEGFGQVNVFSNPELPKHPINSGIRSGLPNSLVELSAPPLKPKPVRFKRGNYLRFWGNYSAQPSYLHFGSLIRSERFIELLPIWYNELDELENEAKAEWSHLEDDSPLEGEADWRRLLNPTSHSPIEFLLHRDRVEQINLLPRSR